MSLKYLIESKSFRDTRSEAEKYTNARETCPSRVPTCPLLLPHFFFFKVNKNDNLLPNVTLGAEIRDDCGTVNIALEQCLNFVLGTFANREQMCFLSRGLPEVNKNATLGGVVGPSYSTTAIQVSKKFNSTLVEVIRIKIGRQERRRSPSPSQLPARLVSFLLLEARLACSWIVFPSLVPRLPAAHFYIAKQSKKKPWQRASFELI